MELVRGGGPRDRRRAPELSADYPKEVLLAARRVTQVIAEQEENQTPRERSLFAQAVLTVALYNDLRAQCDEAVAAL